MSRRWSLTLALLLCAACGAFSGSDTGSDAGSGLDGGLGDATAADGAGGVTEDGPSPKVDAGSVPNTCVPHPGPITIMAADFDDAGATFTKLGSSYALPSDPDGGTHLLIAPGAGLTLQALSIHSAERYVLEFPAQDPGGGVCVITADFDIDFKAVGTSVMPGDTTFAVIGARSTAFDHCYLSFQRNNADLIIQSHCGTRDGGGDYNVSTKVGTAFPIGFAHIKMTLDLPSATATAKIDNGPTAKLDLGTDQVKVGGVEAYAEVGWDGPKVASIIDIDSIRIDVQ